MRSHVYMQIHTYKYVSAFSEVMYTHNLCTHAYIMTKDYLQVGIYTFHISIIGNIEQKPRNMIQCINNRNVGLHKLHKLG